MFSKTLTMACAYPLREWPVIRNEQVTCQLATGLVCGSNVTCFESKTSKLQISHSRERRNAPTMSAVASGASTQQPACGTVTQDPDGLSYMVLRPAGTPAASGGSTVVDLPDPHMRACSTVCDLAPAKLRRAGITLRA